MPLVERVDDVKALGEVLGLDFAKESGDGDMAGRGYFGRSAGLMRNKTKTAAMMARMDLGNWIMGGLLRGWDIFAYL